MSDEIVIDGVVPVKGETIVQAINNPKRRIPVYLSPTGIAKFRQDPEIYYLNYIATHAPGREPQTQPMSIGSSFDAYAKSYLHEALFGKGNDPKYAFSNLFEAQVDIQWRDWAKLHGLYVFEKYKESGTLADLLTDLNQAVNKPKFEIDIMGAINNFREPKSKEMGGVTFLGKPDVIFINKFGCQVVLDFKVNGYCAKRTTSPKPWYVRIREDRKKINSHKDCVPTMHKGVLIHGKNSLHELDIDWGTQLGIYGWLGGVEVGDEVITGIDQICCSYNGTEFPELRFAEHRMLLSPKFQNETFALAQDIWHRTHSSFDKDGNLIKPYHYFTDMSLEDSELRCQLLDTQSRDIALMDPEFLEMTNGYGVKQFWQKKG